MRWWWSLPGSAVSGPELVVEADPGAAWADVAARLGWAQPSDAAGGAMADVAPSSGAVVVGPGGGTAVRAGSGLVPALLVLGGPLAGCRFPLPGTEVSLGSGADDIHLPAPGVVPGHLLLSRTPRGEWLLRPTGNAEVLLDGISCESEAVLTAGSVVQAGACILGVEEEPPEAGQVEPAPGGGIAVVRPLRVRGHRRHARIAVPGPVELTEPGGRRAWVAAGAPATLAVLIALVVQRPAALLLGLLAPLAVAAEAALRRRAGRDEREAARQWHAQATAQALEEMADVTSAQRREAWDRLPDPARLSACVHGWGRQLWERRAEDDDALHVRVGLSVEAAAFTFVDPQQPSRSLPGPGVVAPVPVPVDLRQVGVLHVTGDHDAVVGLGRAVLLHLATLRSPRDLRLVVLCGDHAEAAWRWATWLPHLRGGRRRLLRIGTTASSRDSLVCELRDLLDERAGDAVPRAGGPEDVVIVDATTTAPPPDLLRLLHTGPELDVRFVVLGDVGVASPPGCARLQVGPDNAGTLALPADACDLPLLVDGVPVDVAAGLALGLAPLSHVGGEGERRQPPAFARLVDLLGADRQDPARPAARGRRAGARIVLGVGPGGRVEVDLTGNHPHLVVAGGTAVARCDVLRVAVLGLALDQDPADLSLALIAVDPVRAFAAATRLPHLVPAPAAPRPNPEDIVRHVREEVARRRVLLRTWHVPDLSAAWSRDPHAASQAGLRRLVVAVHEASEVARRHPEVVPDLAMLARDARVCGVHLLLGDERPDLSLPGELLDDALVVRPEPGHDEDGVLVELHESGLPPRVLRLADLSSPRSPRRAHPGVTRLSWESLGDPLPPATPAAQSRAAADPEALVEAVLASVGGRGQSTATVRRTGGTPR